MSETEQEFYNLCMRLLDLRGRGDSVDDSTDVVRSYSWMSVSLGKLMISRTVCYQGVNVLVEHVVDKPDGKTAIEVIWSTQTGFVYERWYEYLEQLQAELILERLSDV